MFNDYTVSVFLNIAEKKSNKKGREHNPDTVKSHETLPWLIHCKFQICNLYEY